MRRFFTKSSMVTTVYSHLIKCDSIQNVHIRIVKVIKVGLRSVDDNLHTIQAFVNWPS
jgi:hypothetical protein